MKHYLCIDVGGTSVKWGLLNEEGHIIHSNYVQSPESLEKMYQVFQDAFDSYSNFDIQGVALSMPGAVNSEKGTIGGSSAYDYIHGPNIKQDLEERFQKRVELENDANCAALAEVWKGAARDVDDCCFIVSGTGDGGAVVKNKQVHKGAHLHGGEFGYMLADFDFRTKELKTWSDISTVAVVKEVTKEKNMDISELSGKDIFDHYHDDPIYKTAVDKFYSVLANGIYNLQYAFDPQKIIIGGAISARGDLLKEVNQRLDMIFDQCPHSHIRPIVLTCKFQNEANLIGALYHFLSR